MKSIILTLEDISLTLGNKCILMGVNGSVCDTDKIGVLGTNGAGKSTLLSVIAGVLEADEGQVTARRGLKISYLAQNPAFDTHRSILDNVVSVIHGKEEHWDTEGEAKALLARFGIDDPDIFPDRLSGGQKKRAALAAAMLTPCDLLILDEPTNHLDHDMIEYLQEWLEDYQGALITVTHDRYFLDEVTDTIWELDRSKLYRYPGNFSEYLIKKQERLDFALAAERKMAALYKQDLKWILRGAQARSTKQKAHIQRFERLRDREKIIEERRVEISSMSSRLGRKTIEITGLSKAYGGKVLFRDYTYFFNKNDRIGIIGKNGCGKSTLLKILLGLEPADSGTVETGSTVKFGYFSQENEELDPRDRVIDCIKGVAEFIRTGEGLISATNMCERFLFDSDMQYTPVSKLSGGEKRRLYLLKVLMGAPNVLILDEPTNDLDIQTLQVLEDYLDHFNGIIIAVSHDRYFLDRVVTRIFSFEADGRLQQSEGAYSEYIAHKLERDGCLDPSAVGAPAKRTAAARSGALKNAAPAGAPGSSYDLTAARNAVSLNAAPAGNPGSSHEMAAADSASAASSAAASGSALPAGISSDQDEVRDGAAEYRKRKAQMRVKKLSYSEQREYDTIEDEIAALEQRVAQLAADMNTCGCDYLKLQELTKEKEAADAELEAKIDRFIELQEKLEALSR